MKMTYCLLLSNYYYLVASYQPTKLCNPRDLRGKLGIYQQFMMKLQPINVVCLSVLSTLSTVTFTMIFQGPLSDMLKDENTFVQSTISLSEIKEPIKWPALTICNSPFDRNTEKFFEYLNKGLYGQSFSNKSEYQHVYEEAFFTKPGDIVHAIGFGTTYNLAMENAKEIPIESPYVVSTFLDMQFVGVCASMSFVALRTKLIEKGEMDEDAIDNKFFAMIGLKVNLISFM